MDVITLLKEMDEYANIEIHLEDQDEEAAYIGDVSNIPAWLILNTEVNTDINGGGLAITSLVPKGKRAKEPAFLLYIRDK